MRDVESYKINTEGNLVLEDIETPFLSYCLDYFYNKKSRDESSGVNNIGLTPKLKAIICFPHNDSIDNDDQKGLIVVPESVAIIYGVALIASAICLAFAGIVSNFTAYSLHSLLHTYKLHTLHYVSRCIAANSYYEMTRIRF